MRIAHLADLHLGQRRFTRITSSGQNQREADINATWLRTVAAVIEERPDVVLIAGDVFHTPRPPNAAISAAILGLSRIATALPDARLVMIAGNHDLPRSSTATVHDACLLSVFSRMGWNVVVDDAKRLRWGDLSILCVPEPVAHTTELTPDESARINVLLLHGEIAGAIPGAPVGAHSIDPARVQHARWTYGALGHYHVHSEIAPRVYYAGGMEYTGSDIWREARSGIPKGFVMFDTDTHTLRFVCPGVAREVIDLPVIEGANMSAAEITAAIEKHEGLLTDGAIARQVVRGVPRERKHDIDKAVVARLRKRCMTYELEVRPPSRPDGIQSLNAAFAERAGVRTKRKSLSEIVREFFERREFPPDIDKKRLGELAQEYLRQAEDRLGEKTDHEEAA